MVPPMVRGREVIPLRSNTWISVRRSLRDSILIRKRDCLGGLATDIDRRALRFLRDQIGQTKKVHTLLSKEIQMKRIQ
jgi:fructose-1,6-bisphosphatase/inositol monophosphatase family enzyme